MRIGLFTDQYYPSVSGVVTSVKMLCEGLTALGHECVIFTSFDEKRRDGSAELTEKTVVNFPGRPYPFRNLKDYRYTLTHGRFVKTVAAYRLDVIHIHTEYSVAKIALKAAKKLRIPVVHTLHTLWSEYLKYVSPFWDRVCHGLMFRLQTAMFTKPVCRQSVIGIVPTRKVFGCAKEYGVGTGRCRDVRIIPTGVDLSRFSDPAEEKVKELRRALGLEGKFVFLYVGRVAKEKNIGTVLRAFAKAFPSEENVRLAIVGGGPDEAGLRAEAAALGIGERTVFTGMTAWSDVPLYYRLGDVFVSASRSETQGLTYVETLASSLPPLIARDDCVADLVTDGVNGVLFEDETDLSRKMRELERNRALVLALRETAAPSVRRYGKEAYAASVLQTYEDAIALFREKVPSRRKKATAEERRSPEDMLTP